MGSVWVRATALAVAFFFFSSISEAVPRPDTPQTRAQHPVESDLAQLGLDFNADNQIVSGQWKGFDTWQRTLCDGRYDYTVDLEARVDDDSGFTFNADGSLDVHARLSRFWMQFSGNWRSQFTLCREVPGWVAATTDWVEIDAHVLFPNADRQRLSSVSVKITNTDFGPLDLGNAVPAWVERQARKILRQELENFWQQHLGDYINQWLSHKASERIRGE